MNENAVLLFNIITQKLLSLVKIYNNIFNIKYSDFWEL